MNLLKTLKIKKVSNKTKTEEILKLKTTRRLQNIRKWVKTLTPLLFFILLIFVILFTLQTSKNLKDSICIKYEIIEQKVLLKSDTIIKSKNIENLLSNNLRELELLRTDIKRVESINDKRFEMLGWGFGILLTTLSVLFVITYFYSKTEAIDVINAELEELNEEYNVESEILTSTLKDKIDELNIELERIREIK